MGEDQRNTIMCRPVILVLAVILSLNAVSAQDKADLTRKERKELKAKRLQESKEALTEFTKNRTLILEANVLRGKYLQHYNVTGDNFILIDGNRIVLQTASAWGVGFNGLGGITLEGRITKYAYEVADGNGPITINAEVIMTGAGFGSLSIHVGADGSATATFRDNWGGRVTFIGNMGDPEDSSVFEGMTFI